MAQTKYIYGYHSVSTALTVMPNDVQTIYLQEKQNNKRHFTILKLAQKLQIKIKYVTSKDLENFAQTSHHQGIVAAIISVDVHTEEYLKVVLDKHQNNSLILILDGVQDPHNLGACLRTANAAGVHAVIVPKDRACGLTPVVYKVASGAVGNTPLIQVTNLVRTIELLKKYNIWVYGAAEDATTSIYQVDLKPPLALVFGAEGDGLRRLTKEKCDCVFKIPMGGVVQNLNVSVAVGVGLFEVVRQHSTSSSL